MRKMITVIIVLLLAASVLAGCNAYGYHVYKENGQYYFKIDNITEDTSDNNDGSRVAQYIHCNSLSEMISDIKSGNFTEEEMDILQEYFLVYQSIDKPAPLPDLDNLYEPILPDGYEIGQIDWLCDKYGFAATNGDIQISISIVSESTYNDGVEFLDERMNAGNTDTYLVAVGDTAYHVWNLDGGTFSIYGISNGQYFRAHIRGVESLSDEFIASIGLKSYTG